MLHYCDKKYFIGLMVLLSGTFGFGQYLHLSNIVDNSISFNHAAAGINKGRSEFGLVYRDQGNRIGNNNFRRLHFFGHTDLTNNVGLGITFNNLMAGEGRSQFVNAVLAVPYHIRIKRKRFKDISISPLVSYLQLSHRETGNFILEENLLGSPGSDVNNMYKQSTIQAGLSLNTDIDLNKVNIQLSYEYLSKAETNAGVFLNDIQKVRANVSYNNFAKDLDLHTSMLFQKSGSERQLLILPSLTFHTPKYTTIQHWNLGMGYRVGDALTFLIGAELLKQYKVYFAYDYTTSGLAAVNNGRGAIELGLGFSFYKEIKQQQIQPIQFYEKLTFPVRQNKLLAIKNKIVTLTPILVRNEMTDAKSNAVVQESKSFVLYHEVNKIGIKSVSQQELSLLLSFVQSNVQRIDSIVITSYTDAKGSNNYNNGISSRRASQLKSTISANGITENKIIWKGLGEINLLNDCYDGVDCIEGKHNENRRTAVTVYVKKGP